MAFWHISGTHFTNQTKHNHTAYEGSLQQRDQKVDHSHIDHGNHEELSTYKKGNQGLLERHEALLERNLMIDVYLESDSKPPNLILGKFIWSFVTK